MCRGRTDRGVSFGFGSNYGVYGYALPCCNAVADCIAEDCAYHACTCGVVYSAERHEYGEADEADEGYKRFGGVSYRHQMPLVVAIFQPASFDSWRILRQSFHELGRLFE